MCNTPSYETPCLIHIRYVVWIEAELCLEEDTGDMYYPHCSNSALKLDVWYSQVSEEFYSVDDVDCWVYIKDVQQLKLD